MLQRCSSRAPVQPRPANSAPLYSLRNVARLFFGSRISSLPSPFRSTLNTRPLIFTFRESSISILDDEGVTSSPLEGGESTASIPVTGFNTVFPTDGYFSSLFQIIAPLE